MVNYHDIASILNYRNRGIVCTCIAFNSFVDRLPKTVCLGKLTCEGVCMCSPESSLGSLVQAWSLVIFTTSAALLTSSSYLKLCECGALNSQRVLLRNVLWLSSWCEGRLLWMRYDMVCTLDGLTNVYHLSLYQKWQQQSSPSLILPASVQP